MARPVGGSNSKWVPKRHEPKPCPVCLNLCVLVDGVFVCPRGHVQPPPAKRAA